MFGLKNCVRQNTWKKKYYTYLWTRQGNIQDRNFTNWKMLENTTTTKKVFHQFEFFNYFNLETKNPRGIQVYMCSVVFMCRFSSAVQCCREKSNTGSLYCTVYQSPQERGKQTNDHWINSNTLGILLVKLGCITDRRSVRRAWA